MTEIGFNDNVAVGGRKFHIQTASNSRKGSVRCEVFEEGRLITTYEIDFERRKQSNEESLKERIKKIVSSVHRETINEIELMFRIADKVKKLKHAPSNIKLGLIFQRNNLLKDAIEQFETALSINPKSAEAMNGLALCHIKLGNFTKAIQILKQALNIGAAYADIYNNLGLAYLYEKQYAKALTNLQEALHINPRYNEAHYNLAILYLESTLHDKTANQLPPASVRIERAKQQLQKLYDTGSKAMKAMETKLTTYIKDEEIEKAVKLLVENRNKVFPEEVLSLIGMDFYLKLMYGGKGLNDDIIRKFEMRLDKAVNDHPNYADLWNNLGIVHLIQCRNLFLQALTEFDQALNINPSFDKALKNKKLVENDGKEFLILLRAILR